MHPSSHFHETPGPGRGLRRLDRGRSGRRSDAGQPPWAELAPHELESTFNPRAAVPDAEHRLAERSARSARAHDSLRGRCRIDADLRYGPGLRQTFDLYRPLDGVVGAPLAVFLHGGYWRALDKRDVALVVPPLLDAGAIVANVNYDLCPQVSLDVIVAEVVAAVRHCHARAADWHADPGKLIVMGHSAGAHLAARVLGHPPDRDGLPADCVAGVVAISGIYETGLVRHLSVNEQVRLDAAAADRHDCLRHPPRRAVPTLVVAGGDEPAGWIDQSLRYAAVVRAAGGRCDEHLLAGHDHFSVLDASFAHGSSVTRAIGAMLAP